MGVRTDAAWRATASVPPPRLAEPAATVPAQDGTIRGGIDELT